MKNISFVGFMGAGKSTISRKIAEQLRYPVFSSDQLIVEREQRNISDIFQNSGEVYFRRVEREVIEELSGRDGVVIDCGGGVVLDPRNISNLKRNGTVIYLSATPAVIFERVKNSTHRPLLRVDDPLAKIKDLLTKRLEFYQKANITINTDHKDIDDVCREILTLI
ncbi:MAG: shikimate kinase [Candidatus Omnitrophica bacterium]|nr:shikimate kinase [Candidatus Omnitrophota bacterium]